LSLAPTFRRSAGRASACPVTVGMARRRPLDAAMRSGPEAEGFASRPGLAGGAGNGGEEAQEDQGGRRSRFGGTIPIRRRATLWGAGRPGTSVSGGQKLVRGDRAKTRPSPAGRNPRRWNLMGGACSGRSKPPAGRVLPAVRGIPGNRASARRHALRRVRSGGSNGMQGLRPRKGRRPVAGTILRRGKPRSGSRRNRRDRFRWSQHAQEVRNPKGGWGRMWMSARYGDRFRIC